MGEEEGIDGLLYGEKRTFSAIFQLLLNDRYRAILMPLWAKMFAIPRIANSRISAEGIHMPRKENFLSALSKLKEAHAQATDALAAIAGGAFSLDGSESLMVSKEMFETYKAAMVEAKIHALQAINLGFF